MGLENKINVGLLIRSELLRDSLSDSLAHLCRFTDSTEEDDFEKYEVFLTDKEPAVLSGLFVNSIKTPCLFLSTQNPQLSIEEYINNNIFRVVSIPNIKDLQRVFETPVKSKEFSEGALEEILLFSQKTNQYILGNNWVFTEEGEKYSFGSRISDEIHFTNQGDSGVYDHLREKMISIRGKKRLISKTEATYQAIKVFYLHQNAKRATTVIQKLSRFAGFDGPPKEIPEPEGDFEKINLPISEEERSILRTLRNHPDVLIGGAFLFLDQVTGFPADSLWSKSIAQDYLKMAEKFLETGLRSEQPTMFESGHSTLLHYETATHHDVFLDAAVDPAAKFKRAIHIKELKYQHGAKVEFTVYEYLNELEQKKRECKKIVKANRRLRSVSVEELDLQFKDTDYTNRQALFYSELPRRNIPGLYPPAEKGMSLSRFLIMDYIGGNLMRTITEKDSFTFFNALPIIDNLGGEFAKEFKSLLVFHKNKSLAELQCFGPPIPSDIEPEQLDYSQKFAEAIINSLQNFGDLPEEDERYIRLAASSINLGLKNSEFVQVAGDFSAKNNLFQTKKHFETLEQGIWRVKKGFDSKGINSLVGFIRENVYDIDYEKAHRYSHPFDSRQHDKFGHLSFSPEEEKLYFYHFLLCVGKFNALKRFKDKKIDFSLVNDVDHMIKELQKGDANLTYSEIFTFLKEKKITPYKFHDNCLEDWHWMGAYRNAKDLAFEIEEGYFNKNKKDEDYLGAMNNYVVKTLNYLEKLALSMEKIMGHRLDIDDRTLDHQKNELKERLDNPSSNPIENQLVKVKYLSNTLKYLSRKMSGYP